MCSKTGSCFTYYVWVHERQKIFTTDLGETERIAGESLCRLHFLQEY